MREGIRVNPKILVWARKTAGLTLQEAATKISVVQHSLEKIEKGEKAPSHSMLLRMANRYRRPLLTFYLENIPLEASYGADFRGLSEQITPKDEALIAALLRYAKASQQMIRATLEQEEERVPLSFVGWLRRKWGLPQDTELVNHELGSMSRDQQSLLTRDALRGINMVLGDQCTRDKYYEAPSSLTAFKLLRSSCEDSGIFIVLKGDLGSIHSKLPDRLFRAFVIADDIAPFMVINKRDPRPAWSFSVLHEIIHLLLDQTGVSDLQQVDPIEKFCNRVAGEWLLPSRLIKEKQISLHQGVSELKEIISEVSQKRNLSHTMVATRFYQERVISHVSFLQLERYYTAKWEESRHRSKETQNDKQAGGPSFYRVRRNELGGGLLQFAKRMIQSERLTVSKAAIIMSVKPGQVSRLLKS
ncbi:MAG: XRE family transcriptional regulator [Bacteroidetes bacterium]|nr:XRE family transcriptional regulator [Bacteroidota bacterium]MDE2670993.1 XRE family transcriptional regulator [Bacteroidota bacterium]